MNLRTQIRSNSTFGLTLDPVALGIIGGHWLYDEDDGDGERKRESQTLAAFMTAAEKSGAFLDGGVN